MWGNEAVTASTSSRGDMCRAVTARHASMAATGRDVEQRIHTGDWAPGGVVCVDLPPGVTVADPRDCRSVRSDGWGYEHDQNRARSTRRDPVGATAIPVRSGAGSRR